MMPRTRHIPQPRITSDSRYGSGEVAQYWGETWLEAESFCYPSASFRRRAYVILERNPHNPIALPYGEKRLVRCGIADTYSTIPARMWMQGLPGVHRSPIIKGYLTVDSPIISNDPPQMVFIPEADPTNCLTCATGEGCKKGVSV